MLVSSRFPNNSFRSCLYLLRTWESGLSCRKSCRKGDAGFSIKLFGVIGFVRKSTAGKLLVRLTKNYSTGYSQLQAFSCRFPFVRDSPQPLLESIKNPHGSLSETTLIYARKQVYVLQTIAILHHVFERS